MKELIVKKRLAHYYHHHFQWIATKKQIHLQLRKDPAFEITKQPSQLAQISTNPPTPPPQTNFH